MMVSGVRMQSTDRDNRGVDLNMIDPICAVVACEFSSGVMDHWQHLWNYRINGSASERSTTS
jgi:hypothetical protein